MRIGTYILCHLLPQFLDTVDVIVKRVGSAVLDFGHYSDCAIYCQVT